MIILLIYLVGVIWAFIFAYAKNCELYNSKSKVFLKSILLSTMSWLYIIIVLGKE